MEPGLLGYTMTFHRMPRLKVAVQSVKRLRGKLKAQFRAGRGRAIDATIKDLAPILRGWTAYFKLADVKGRSRKWMDGFTASCGLPCGGNGRNQPRAQET